VPVPAPAPKVPAINVAGATLAPGGELKPVAVEGKASAPGGTREAKLG
jgi:hypothetical protein